MFVMFERGSGRIWGMTRVVFYTCHYCGWSVSGGRSRKIRKIKITGGRAKDCNGTASSSNSIFIYIFAKLSSLYSPFNGYYRKTKLMRRKILLSASAPADNTMWAIFQIVSTAGKEFSITKAQRWKGQKNMMKRHNHKMSKEKTLNRICDICLPLLSN